jgi:hypothetical protein
VDILQTGTVAIPSSGYRAESGPNPSESSE